MRLTYPVWTKIESAERLDAVARTLDGFELAQLVFERWPSKKVLLTSGLSGGVGDKLEEQAMGVTVIRKPYRKADLARAVRATLAA